MGALSKQPVPRAPRGRRRRRGLAGEGWSALGRGELLVWSLGTEGQLVPRTEQATQRSRAVSNWFLPLGNSDCLWGGLISRLNCI